MWLAEWEQWLLKPLYLKLQGKGKLCPGFMCWGSTTCHLLKACGGPQRGLHMQTPTLKYTSRRAAVWWGHGTGKSAPGRHLWYLVDSAACPGIWKLCHAAVQRGCMWLAWLWCRRWEQGAWVVLLCFSTMLLCLMRSSHAAWFLIRLEHLETDTAALFFFYCSGKCSGCICHK